MGKQTYFVDVIRPGCERDYEDYWTRGHDRDASGKTLTPEVVADTARIRASNRREAVMLARERHPARPIGHVGKAPRGRR